MRHGDGVRRGFTPEWMDQLRSRIDIVDVVGESVPLKKSGSRYTGLCPFHQEKSPSFSVSQDTQLYYCFGCKAGGDVVRFVMDAERMTFPEAVRSLADRARLPLPDENDPVSLTRLSRERGEREKILELNRKAARWYFNRLWTDEGKAALGYLYNRGLDDAAIRRFGLGATGPDSAGLSAYLLGEGADEDIIVKASLCVKRDGRLFDFFRGRVMFPIMDAKSNVIAFGGRAIGDQQPKYLNSPDTPVYNKRQHLYGMHELRKARSLKRVTLVEGYMDAVSLMNAGVVGVVATLGTSLTPEQVKLVRKYAPEILVAYDGDSAGQNAALRAIDLLQADGAAARVVTFPDGMDPDDFVKKEGLAGFDALVSSGNTRSAYQFRLTMLASRFDLSNPDERMRFAIEAAVILRTVKDPVELDMLLDRLIVDTGYAKETLYRQVESTPMPPRNTSVKADRPARNGAAMLDAHHQTMTAARTLLSLMAMGKTAPGFVDCDDFTNETHRTICRALIEGKSATAILDEAADEDVKAEMLSSLFGGSTSIPEEKLPRVIGDCVERLRGERLDNRKRELAGNIAEQSGSQRMESLREMQELLLRQVRQGAGLVGRVS